MTTNATSQTHVSGFTPWRRFRIRAMLAGRRLADAWVVFRRDRLAVLGLVIIFLFALMAIAHPILMNTIWPRKLYDPLTGFDQDMMPHPSQPSSRHLLGTDVLGRDVLSMLLAATTPTFVVGLTAALTTAVLSLALSMAAAYFRGTVDTIITNLVDVVILLPAPILMIIVGARWRDLGPLPLGMIYGAITGSGSAAIVMRSQALKVANKPFMEAAHIAGGGAVHIIVKHFLPNMLPLAALQMMISVSGAVIADGFIAFFGLKRLTNNWGTLIYDAFLYSTLGTGQQWHILIPTATAFSLFALSFYLVSRGLHRVADPRMRSEQ